MATIPDKKKTYSIKLSNSVVDNQVSRGRVVTRKVSENCKLDSDTHFAVRTIDAKSKAASVAIYTSPDPALVTLARMRIRGLCRI